MRTFPLACILIASSIAACLAQTLPPPPRATELNADATGPKQNPAVFSIVERGENHRVWQRIMQETDNFGRTAWRTNAYNELETGMHYRAGDEWRETRAEIELLADGAAATNGPHKVFFSANLNSVGAVDLTTPDGQRLRSRVFGLSYFDAASGKVVLIAETQDSIGQLIYPIR